MTENEQLYVLRKFRNRSNAAEGPIVPPRQIGFTRVPLITGLQVINRVKLTNGTNFILSWIDPIVQGTLTLDHFNVVVSGVRGDPNSEFQLMAVVFRSPATVFVGITTTGTPIKF